MKRSITLWQFMGFAVTSLLGTLLHFMYEWLGQSILIAPFSGVNESTWEHMKLLFWPAFIYAVFERFFFRDIKDFYCVKLRGITAGLVLIPVLFYTYNGVIGESPDYVNIAIFFISLATAFIYETRLFKSEKPVCKSQKKSFLLLLLIAGLFVLFTFITPRIGIFRDPISGTYGI